MEEAGLSCLGILGGHGGEMVEVDVG